jgi:nitrogen-specific signal transduction histidine kinase
MEALTGSAGAPQPGGLRELFPASMLGAEVRGQSGIHQIFKVPLQAHPWSASSGNGAASGSANGNGNATQSAEKLPNIAIAPLVTRDGQQIGRLIIFDDITERTQLEQRLIQADKLSSIGLLAAGVAHEVNTPLAVISTYAQMLTKQIASEDPKARLLEKIAKQTFRASEIVNSLLNFSRTSKSEFESMDLNRAVRETLSLVEHQLARAAVRVEFLPSDDLPLIRGNSGKMQQVFLNLFLNARDAMEEGGVLRISTSTVMAARIEGPIRARASAEDLPGFMTRSLPRSRTQGTGLGLAVTCAESCGAQRSIDVISKVAGTRFRLNPVARKLSMPDHTRDLQLNQPGWRGRVLVDDTKPTSARVFRPCSSSAIL